jgi:uncharacterized protein YeaO (DUF488 family)
MPIRLKRAYEKPTKTDGYRVLVDRIWPRGIRKEDLKIDEWLKEIAPSAKLRKWFGHDPKKWGEFKSRYFKELGKHSNVSEKLLEKCDGRRVTLVFGAKDESHNNAVALKEFLLGQRNRRSSG